MRVSIIVNRNIFRSALAGAAIGLFAAFAVQGSGRKTLGPENLGRTSGSPDDCAAVRPTGNSV
jgi:hypothetical protein